MSDEHMRRRRPLLGFDMQTALSMVKDLVAAIERGDDPMPKALIFAIAAPCQHGDVEGVDLQRVFESEELDDLHSLLVFVEQDIDGELEP
jgi:hypothetical protein